MNEPIQDRLTDLSGRLNPMKPNIQPSDSKTVREAVCELYSAWRKISELEEKLEKNHWFSDISPVFQPELVEVARVFETCHPSEYDCASDMIRDIYLKTPECNLPTGI